jgi:hypothetical protein
MSQVTCKKCGSVAFEVTRKYAVQEVSDFNEYFDSLPFKEQDQYYGGRRSSILNYEHCGRCGASYKEFRTFQEGDCPDGCTLNPIIRIQD